MSGQWACEEGHADCVKLLIPHCDPMADNAIGLLSAISFGRASCVELLLPHFKGCSAAEDLPALARMCSKDGHAAMAALVLSHFERLELSSDTPAPPRSLLRHAL